MAAELPCDFCGDEAAVLMMNSLTDGTVVTVGAACLPLFFGGALLGAIGSDGHAGPPTKCQACRRTHERMTTPVAPLTAQAPDDDSEATTPADDSEAATAP